MNMPSYHYYKKKVEENGSLVQRRREDIHRAVEKANLSIEEAKEIVKVEFLGGVTNAQITSTEFIVALGTILEI